ncbi:hypothetical protein AYI68_g3025 [Smittium mucronatum]|uniref:Uncharacterized protein n=1 Tax=Smittium mucronatum TaxID=133383 RepID=A0A1R0H151_9FUNG|nr:hypothetical protein AYI68_g3025 [Smittium mucronatum]
MFSKKVSINLLFSFPRIPSLGPLIQQIHKKSCIRSFSAISLFDRSLFNCHRICTRIYKKPFIKPLILPFSSRWYSKNILKAKGPQCSGCGAEFQNADLNLPGYLPPQLWDKFNNLRTAADSLDSAVISHPTPTPKEECRTVSNIPVSKNSLSPEIADEIFKKVVEDEISSEFILSEPSLDEIKPAQTPKTGQEIVDRILCQRCFTIKNYNRVDSHWKKDIVSDPKALQFLKYNFQALVIVVVDLFDLPASFIPELSQFIGEQHRVILVANKSDLLPADANLQRLKLWLSKQAQVMNVPNIRNIHFVSAQKNLNIRELAKDIQINRKPHQDIFFVGRANVGKSELINSLLRISYKTYYKHKLVASQIPGTTIGVNGIPLVAFRKSLIPMSPINNPDADQTIVNNEPKLSPEYRNRFVYDTPGVFSSKNIVNYLKNNELDMVIPGKTKIKPLTFLLNPGQSIMFGGCGRLDYLGSSIVDSDEPSQLRITVFSKIPIHKSTIKKTNLLFEKLYNGQATVLVPPINSDPDRLAEFPKLKEALNIKVDGTHSSKAWLDVCFSGIGWFSLSGTGKDLHLVAYSPNGIGVNTRDPMLPFEYKHWIKKYTSNTRKTPN